MGNERTSWPGNFDTGVHAGVHTSERADQPPLRRQPVLVLASLAAAAMDQTGERHKTGPRDSGGTRREPGAGAAFHDQVASDTWGRAEEGRLFSCALNVTEAALGM